MMYSLEGWRRRRESLCRRGERGNVVRQKLETSFYSCALVPRCRRTPLRKSWKSEEQKRCLNELHRLEDEASKLISWNRSEEMMKSVQRVYTLEASVLMN